MAKKTSHKSETVQLAQLSQSPEAWQVDYLRARLFYKDEQGDTVRPYLILVVDQSGVVLGTELTEDEPLAQRVWEQVVKAMRQPMEKSIRPHRPARIVLCQQYLLDELGPEMQALGIQGELVQELPGVQEAATALAEHMNQDAHPSPALSSVPGVTSQALEQFYTLTNEFFELAPWEDLDDERPIEIRCPADAAPRYVVIMGGLGEEFGLAVYDQAQDILDVFDSEDPQESVSRCSWMALSYNEIGLIPFDDLDLIDQNEWPVAGEDAYPAFYRIAPPKASAPRRGARRPQEPQVQPATAEDLAWLEGTLLALNRFFDRDVRMDEFGLVEPAQRTYRLKTLGGRVDVVLRFPAPIGPWEQVKPSRRRAGGKLDEDRQQAVMERMMRRFEAQDYDEVIEIGESLLDVLPELAPGRFELLALLGSAYGMIEEYDNAYRVFTLALDLRPQEAAMWANRSLAASYSGRNGQAQLDMERAVALAGKSKESRRYAHDLKEVRKAVDLELKRRAPGFTLEQLVVQEDLYRQAQDCLERNDWDGSMQIMQQAIAMDDCKAEAQNLLGVCLMFRMRLGEAQAAMRRALELDPEFEAARENLDVAQRLEKSGKTLEDFFRDEGMLRISPDQEQDI